MMSTTVEAIRVQEVIACARSFVRATTKERAARKKTEENDDDNDDVEDTALAATFSHASKNGDDGTVETEVFLRALYTAVDESMQRLVESETRVQRARKSAEDATTTTGSITIASMETPPRDGKRGEMVDGARMARTTLGPHIDDCAQFPSLSSSPTMATPATAAKTLGGMSLKSNECNKTGASPSPRRVTPSPVSSGGPGGTSGVAGGFFPTTTSEKSKRRGLRRAETDSTVFALGSIEYYQQYSQ